MPQWSCVLCTLWPEGQMDASVVQEAIDKYDINNPQAAEPVPDNDPE